MPNLPLAAAALASGALWLWLAAASRGPAPVSVWLLLAVLLSNGALWLGVCAAARAGRVHASGWLWAGALAFRLCGAFAEPVLEDDPDRFLWDGFVFAATGNPYASTPADWFGDAQLSDTEQALLDRVGYPDVPTIYGPVCEYAFGVAHWIAPGELWPWKLLLLFADFALFALLRRAYGAGAAWIYAWCPLLVFETYFNAHPELLAVALAWVALQRSLRGRHGSACCLVGLAVAARVSAVLLIPFVAWRAGWRRAAWIPAAIALAYLPFWLQGSAGDLAGLRAFAGSWEFNSSVFALLGVALPSSTARVVALALAGAALTAVFARWKKRGAAELVRGEIAYGALLLCSPVVNPWYLLWLLPFVCVRPSWTGLGALVLVSLSYCHAMNLAPGSALGFDHPTWVRVVEYGGLALVFAVESIARRRRRARTAPLSIE